MRLYRLAPILVIAVVATGCASGTGAKQTRTVVVTQTQSGAPASTTPATSPGGTVTVTPGTTPDSPATATSSTAATPATTSPPADLVKVDPTKIDCHLLVTPPDVKTIFGASMGDQVNLIRIAADPKIGMTGKLRCTYGASPKAQEWPVVISMTKYSDAAAAKKQIDVTVQSERDLGAKYSPTTVKGLPASMLVRDGGLIVMVYDTWTLAVATSATFVPAAKLSQGLPKLAEVVLNRILNNA